jgi:co-chaperonin GroES (HSP10)
MSKNNMRTIGKWVSVQTEGLGKEKKTKSGIIYKEKITNPNIWSKVVGVGDKITEDIKVGDKVLWDITKGGGRGWGGCDIIHQDHILAVEREED